MRHSTTLLLLALSLAVGCDGGKDDTGSEADGGASGDGDGGGAAGDGGVEASGDWCGVQEVFEAKCTSCHSGGSPAGALDLQDDAHGAIVGVASALYSGQVLVVPSEPESSFLLAKVEGTHDDATQGDIMPPGPGLSEANAAIVREWIAAGATTDCAPEGDGGAADGGAADGGGDGSIVGPELHVNGTRDVVFEHADTMTYDAATVTCEGECHREKHRRRSWVYTGPG